MDWVVQVDAPEDAETYVHRAGRAARNDKAGNAMLLVVPSEEARVAQVLADAKIPIAKVALNPKRKFSVAKHVQALVAQRPDVKTLAQKCFTGYVRSVVLSTDKLAFDATKLPLKAYALSLGLANAPRVKLPSTAADSAAARDKTHAAKNQNRKLQKLKEQIAQAKAAKKRGAKDAKEHTTRKTHDSSDDDDSDDDDSDDDRADDCLVLKGSQRDIDAIVVPDAPALSRKKRKEKKQKIDASGEARNAVYNTKKTFGDDGEIVDAVATSIAAADPAPKSRADLEKANEDFVNRMRDRLMATDAEDRDREKARKKALKMAKKGPKKTQHLDDDDDDDDDDGPRLATLANAEPMSESDDDDSDSD